MPVPDSRIRSTHSADGGIVINIESGKMFSLNASGSAMFQLLAKGLNEATLVEELVRRFGISASVAKCDLDDFRSALNIYSLIPSKEVVSPE